MLGLLSPLVFMVLVGCAHRQELSYNSLVLKDDYEKKVVITTKEFKEDLEFLRYALKNAYGGFVAHPKETVASVNTKLENLSYESNPLRFCEKVSEILTALPDRHLRVSYFGKECALPEPRVDFGKNLNTSEKSWKGFQVKRDIYVLAISDFPPGHWPGFLEFLQEARAKARAIVIDLRGNRGGSDSNSISMVNLLTDQEVRIPYARSTRRQTPETLIAQRNIFNVIQEQTKDPDQLKRIEQFQAKIQQDLEAALSGKLPEYSSWTADTSPWSYNTKLGFRGPIYILQDRRCISSCESTIDFFEYLPNVTRVGSHSGGTLQFGDIGLVMLPHSGIQFDLASKFHAYRDNRFVETIGIKPDVSLSPGQDAYEYVMKKLLKTSGHSRPPRSSDLVNPK